MEKDLMNDIAPGDLVRWQSRGPATDYIGVIIRLVADGFEVAWFPPNRESLDHQWADGGSSQAVSIIPYCKFDVEDHPHLRLVSRSIGRENKKNLQT
jgi:hypothetical protein|tara:strand:- start:559 stop:849 length:291 start_codon:yes stop_codon:yes gene_type:complete